MFAHLVRACFTAYEKKDRAALEKVLSADFTFTSPLDDNISRELYFERCWPQSEKLLRFNIEKIVEAGDSAYVTYEATLVDGKKFRNTEVFRVDGHQISHVDVYFGSETVTAACESEIRELVDATVKACCAKDAENLIAHYAPDVLAFDLINPLQYSGANEVRKRVTEWFASFEGPIDYSVHDLKVKAEDGAAFCHSLNQVKGTTTSGQKLEMYWRATLCWQKRAGKWLVTHAHNSVPFDMKTGKASMDLKP